MKAWKISNILRFFLCWKYIVYVTKESAVYIVCHFEHVYLFLYLVSAKLDIDMTYYEFVYDAKQQSWQRIK